MFVEIHILQNFSPSCLNRDDTNAPKDCEFGGYRRARISSQCIKRAVRRHFSGQRLLDPGHLSHRTKRLVETLTGRLQLLAREPQESLAVAEALVKGVGLGLKEENRTEYLLFLGEDEIVRLAQLANDHFDALKGLATPANDDPPVEGKKKKTAKEKKKEASAAIPPELKKAGEKVFDGGKASDLALFGRMLADLPERNIDAACQVAHALSTNRVTMEMDYYTAVDDLKPDDTAGADMIGTVEFNSSCFYRYANIDVGQLQANLQNDTELVGQTVEAFLRASVEAIPTGKQNSMAAQNPPDLVMVVVRERGLWSLANAFVQPIRADRDCSLMQRSITALDSYWGKLAGVYGDKGIAKVAVCTTEQEQLDKLACRKVDSIEQVYQSVREALTGHAPQEVHA